MRSDRHRLRRWQQFFDPIDLNAIELLLVFLTSASQQFRESDQTVAVSFLSARIADDIKLALECVLSGNLPLASDVMRDSIETELLIRDFSLDTDRINQWSNASEEILSKQFRPVRCRERQAKALGVKINDVPGATDYKMHSKILHVGPPLVPALSPAAGHEVTFILSTIADIIFHGRSAINALTSLLKATNHHTPKSKDALRALDRAAKDLDTVINITYGIENFIAKAISPDGRAKVLIFESGLVVAVDMESRQQTFFAASGSDFRRTHGNISRERPLSFELRPFDDTEN
jgi:hypothetical protein